MNNIKKKRLQYNLKYIMKVKEICKCGHKIDAHIEQYKGKARAGSCFLCDCRKYTESKQIAYKKQ